MKLNLDDVVAAVAFVAFLAAGYLLVQWITVSFTITNNGPIRWEDGWEETKCIYLECEG